ncbi:hypothetical protein I317_03634 [Kwoniella heveanensis CBS 569]|nr:hypothetical protein I317_03634 [Kwoniella heveanensis CBS 569]
MSLALPSNNNSKRNSNDPFTTPERSPSSSDSALNEIPSNQRASGSFVPPPLPPRPTPAGKRKPVPSYPANGSLESPVPRSNAPPLPPRGGEGQQRQSQTYTLTAAAPTYVDENIVDQSRLPPPPVTNEKNGNGYGPYPPRKREKWWYPSTTRGRRWWWGILLSLILAIAIVIAVVAVVFTRKHNNSSDSGLDDDDSPDAGNAGVSTGNTAVSGGHPLSIADGGVNIGKPGDIAKFGKYSTDHFVMTTNRSIAVTRLDPIVNPNAPASHLHRIHGSSYFTANLTTATDMQKLANCTTTVVQDDKSAYWVAQLYYQYPNGSMITVPLDRTSLYYFQKAPTGVPIYPFPDNYNLVAGNPMRRAINYTDPDKSAMWWQCYRGNTGADTKNYGFPSTDCAGGLVSAIQFPSCWDGVYAEDADYSSHVAYPTDGTNGYYCPDGEFHKFITLQFETVFATYKLPFNGAGKTTWVLSNGDTSGYGIHADFMNGWKPDVLQSVLDNCRYMNATKEVQGMDHPANCPALNATINMDITYSCQLQTEIVDEPVGQTTPIQYLPGCNGIWNGNETRPACPGDHIEGGYLEMTKPGVWLRNEPYVS